MKYVLPILFLLAVSACSSNQAPADNQAAAGAIFGDTITADSAAEATQLVALMGDQGRMNVKLKGTITGVCQKKGCWMNMDLGNDQAMTVRFKDYGFFVPKDASGKTAIIEGEAFHDTVSVAELRHYAEDAGKSKEEIEKITEPEVSLNFEARGVIILDSAKAAQR